MKTFHTIIKKQWNKLIQTFFQTNNHFKKNTKYIYIHLLTLLFISLSIFSIISLYLKHMLPLLNKFKNIGYLFNLKLFIPTEKAIK